MNVYKDCQKSENQKSKLVLPTLATAWLSNIAFHLWRFGCKPWLRSIQNHARHRFQAFARSHLKLLCCSIQIWADALSSGQVVDLDLLLCTGFDSEHAALFLCPILSQRLMNDQKVARSDERCFYRQQLLTVSIDNFILKTKTWLVTPRTLQGIKTVLALELSQYRKSDSKFSSSEPIAAAATAADSAISCACAPPSYLLKLCRSAAPRAQPMILQSKRSIIFWNSLREWLSDARQSGRRPGARIRTENWTLPPDRCIGFICSDRKNF